MPGNLIQAPASKMSGSPVTAANATRPKSPAAAMTASQCFLPMDEMRKHMPRLLSNCYARGETNRPEAQAGKEFERYRMSGLLLLQAFTYTKTFAHFM